MKVLFVCLGNICRSPAAEAVFQKMLIDQQLESVVEVDSAGTGAYHVGERADSRMRRHGQDRGYDLTSRARQVESNDFDRFDYIITMDHSNFQNVSSLTDDQDALKRVRTMCSFCTSRPENEVPDPYYGGSAGFETVYDILEDACAGLLDEVCHRLKG